MKNMFLAIYIICSLAMSIAAQQKECCQSKTDVIFSRDKPTIYLSFEGLERRKPEPARLAAPDTAADRAQEQISGEVTSQVMRFRLHNNTRWAISFSTDSLYVGSKTTPLPLDDGRGVLGLRDGAEVNIRYGVEAEPGAETKIPLPRDRIDVYSTSWLPSGRSVTFVVPREYGVKGRRIYVSFNYQWETTERDNGSSEPEHRAYFRMADLPRNIAEK
jgi:hypothetical protein